MSELPYKLEKRDCCMNCAHLNKPPNQKADDPDFNCDYFSIEIKFYDDFLRYESPNHYLRAFVKLLETRCKHHQKR